MARVVNERMRVPAEARPVVDLVEDAAFDWEYEGDFPIMNVRVTQRVQVRAEKHYTPRHQVKKYELGWTAGDKFPPVVVTRNGFIVDGNTRVVAAQNVGRERIPAVIVNADWVPPESSPTKEQREINDRLISLGAGFNMRNGEGIDRRELYKALRALDPSGNYDINRVAHRFMCPPSTVRNIFYEGQALQRAERVGLQPNGRLNPSQLRVLGRADMQDVPFKEYFSLAEDAGLSAKELGALAKAVKAQPDTDRALALLQQERVARSEQITQHKAWGTAPQPPLARQAKQHLGFFRKYEHNPTLLREHNPAQWQDYRHDVQCGIAVLQAVDQDIERLQRSKGL